MKAARQAGQTVGSSIEVIDLFGRLVGLVELCPSSQPKPSPFAASLSPTKTWPRPRAPSLLIAIERPAAGCSRMSEILYNTSTNCD